jgi:NADPH-dependent 2,4-dienoyl-CoA reductase/sulfur reductase-like enzyme/peroxiredoxin family protein/TusA-related sulfurtransferase/rhodanese-related sulfurtransferase
MKKVVIIGGVAGGASCAARLRRLDEEAEIVLLERGKYVSYANCGLPYHVGDVIKSRDALLVSTPEMLRSRFKIDVRTQHEALSVDRAAKTVSVRDADDRVYTESYDTLVISTGSSPLRPPIPGIDSPRVMTLWTVPDTDKIRDLALHRGYRRAAVIGGGFIGLEIAENLKHAGLDVSLIEGSDQVMPPMDPEMASLLHEHLEDNGIHLHLSDPVSSFAEIEDAGSPAVRVTTDSGYRIAVDFVILAIGIRPNNQLAKNCGLELGEKGGIRVDEFMKTSDESIYAVGDVSETVDFITGERASYQLAGPANKQGRIAADNICGAQEAYRGTMGASIAKVFDLSAGMTGKSEKALVRQGLERGRDYEKTYITQNQHAGYYPGAVPLTMKLLFAPDGSKIFGAQIIGRKGVDKRIDDLSIAIRAGLKAVDLAELELAYAPPYSSAKDPVNMAGFVIRNMTEGLVKFADWDEPERGSAQLLDVREDAERLAFEIPHAIGIPLGELRSHLDELDRSRRIIVFCAIGVRSYSAARILMNHGFGDVAVYPAGTRFYQSTHYKELSAGSTQPEMDSSTDDTGLRAGGAAGGMNGDSAGGMNGSAGNADTDRSAADAASGGSGRAAGHADQDGAARDDIRSLRIDCNGMQCPGPILKVYETMKEMQNGDELEVTASDPGFAKDIVAWCRRTGNTILANDKVGDEYIARLKKGIAASAGGEAGQSTGGGAASAPAPADGGLPARQRDGKTLIVFSGDLDKVLASFIIANGAAAMGKPVTMFFTFWGLSVLRRHEKVKIKKTRTEAMFGSMLPRGSADLKLSRMNMGGIGTKMMRKIMNDKNVDSLEDLIQKAMDNGVKIVACTMSMDVMGIKPEELIPGVELGGVGYYLGDAEESDVDLFI